MIEKKPLGSVDPTDHRCLCGSLLARRVADGVELKCRRCKRTHIIPLIDLMEGAPSPQT